MKIALGSDHRGFRLKEEIKGFLETQGHEVLDFGTSAESPSVDYPDIAFQVGENVARVNSDRGVLICMTGIGMCIAANKVKGVRAALATDARIAEFSRKHNDANVLCLQGGFIDPQKARVIVEIFLATEYEGGRHERRIEKISERESS
jgi:ribose 5-phosphate isomerase B